MRWYPVASTLVLLIFLAGCAAPSIDVDAPPSSAATAQATVDQLPLYGHLVSQGAQTTGTVTLVAISADEFTLTLDGFSTGAGEDLRLRLSTGQLVRGSDGAYYVDGNSLELAGTVASDAPTQSFTFPRAMLTIGNLQSFTIYDYANRIALGSAALTAEPKVLTEIVVTSAACDDDAVSDAVDEALAMDTESEANAVLALPSDVPAADHDDQFAAWQALSDDDLTFQLCLHLRQEGVSG